MGKGDIRSRKGKIWRGTYGVSRPSKRKNRAPRLAAAARNIKTLKDLPKVVTETVQKPVAVEPVATEISVPAKVQAPVENTTAVVENSNSAVEAIETTVAAESSSIKVKKTAAKKSVKPAVKKTAAKKAPVKKKK